MGKGKLSVNSTPGPCLLNEAVPYDGQGTDWIIYLNGGNSQAALMWARLLVKCLIDKLCPLLSSWQNVNLDPKRDKTETYQPKNLYRNHPTLPSNSIGSNNMGWRE